MKNPMRLTKAALKLYSDGYLETDKVFKIAMEESGNHMDVSFIESEYVNKNFELQNTMMHKLYDLVYKVTKRS